MKSECRGLIYQISFFCLSSQQPSFLPAVVLIPKKQKLNTCSGAKPT
jgi:hypothetical protein